MTDTTTAALIGAGAVCGSILAMLGLAGVFWKIALPWLREQIVAPVQQSNRALTVNHHTSTKPTVLDLLDDLRSEIGSLRTEVSTVDSKVQGVVADVAEVDDKASRIGRQLDAHLTSAAATDEGVAVRLKNLEEKP